MPRHSPPGNPPQRETEVTHHRTPPHTPRAATPKTQTTPTTAEDAEWREVTYMLVEMQGCHHFRRRLDGLL